MKSARLQNAFGIVVLVMMGAMMAVGTAGAVETKFSAFKQAVAEAAADDRQIAAFYRETGYDALWTAPGEAARDRRGALLSAMAAAGLHGLPEDRYDADRLMRMLASVRGPRERGFAEVALARALVGLARDLQAGVLDPSAVVEGIKRQPAARDAAYYLTGLTETDRPRGYIRTLAPRTREYARLMKHKLRLEQVIRDGGWGKTVPGGALERGDSGPAVVALRDRLMRMGYLERTPTMTYDDAIETAVAGFQERHGLAVDGKAGANTLVEINRPAEARLRSVIVAMERERWLHRETEGRQIIVNLTDFSARILDDDRITFQTRAVVGANAADRRTPEFSDRMEHLIVNPTWHVPRSIVVNEYLPQMKANPGAAGHLRLYRGGQPVSRAGINFNAYNASNFPFDLKQPPSNSNALGLVKFMFPNKYNIYLHDTPAKHLFQRDRRAYSHGCIRLNDPFDFAYQLLARQEQNPQDFFQSVLATGQETQVDLKRPVPVHLIYRTAFTDARGQVHYRQDVYGRDARIWNALMDSGLDSVATREGIWQPRQARPAPQPQPARQPRAMPARVGQTTGGFRATGLERAAPQRRVIVVEPRSSSRQFGPPRDR